MDTPAERFERLDAGTGTPPFSEEDKLVAISLVCEGAVGYKDIKEREIIPVLRDWLSGWQAKALDGYAPVSLTLPNGQHAKVRYGEDSTPVIGLTVQRLFGVAASPRIANGAVAVKVEVLAPSQRPWQVTGSLESFWRNGYGQMKKTWRGAIPGTAGPIRKNWISSLVPVEKAKGFFCNKTVAKSSVSV